MKGFLFGLIAFLTVLAFATGAMVAEKKASQPEVVKVTGAVTVYIAPSQADWSTGTLTVKDSKGKNWTFDVPPDTKIKGELTRGATATVNCKKEAGKMVATSIGVIPAKKSAALRQSRKPVV